VLFRSYFDADLDQKSKEDYYRDVSFGDDGLKLQIERLLEKTHRNRLTYTPYRYVYPWVDLQEDGKLKSLYSGKSMDPLKAIETDLQLLAHMENTEPVIVSGKFNCEHVVPQSWFLAKEPMRGDLHHLFACEPSCNSMRGNSPYYDFTAYSPEGMTLGIRQGCGMAEDGRFEPEYGKGIAARATLYFLKRYGGTIDIKDKVNLNLLMEWHDRFHVSIYEKHRNTAIFALQGNRNPFIDYPEMASNILGFNY
jgi:deoxyribonuclease I